MSDPIEQIAALIATWRGRHYPGLTPKGVSDLCADELEPLAAALREAQPVNWEASYHQACEDADAYKAEAEKRATKLEQNWRSCQHNEGYLRERLTEAQQQIAALRTTLNAANRRIDILDEQIAALTTDIAVLITERDNLNETIVVLVRTVNDQAARLLEPSAWDVHGYEPKEPKKGSTPQK